MGQEKKLTISGHVFDENNESLPGVSVYLKDRAGVGTSTDVDGAFKLSAQKGDMIIFSFIGYKKKEHIALKDEKDLKIILKNDAQQMDEVVITGMKESQPYRSCHQCRYITDTNTCDFSDQYAWWSCTWYYLRTIQR